MSLDKSYPAPKIKSSVTAKPIFADVKAIFFDLDDTLCAYWDAAKRGLRATFDCYPIAGHTTDEMIEHWGEAFRTFAPMIKNSHWYDKYLQSGEITRVELMRLLLERIGNFDTDLASRLSDTYYVERHAALELFPEAEKVLGQLHSSFTVGVITNGPADIQRQEIETLRIKQFLDHILIEGEMGKGKPSPEVMARAEELCGYSGAAILFVGNSYKHDIVPAINACWRQAWVRRPSDVPPTSNASNPAPMPENAPEPDLTITDLRELLPALGIEEQL